MLKTKLVFGTYNSLPVGSADYQFEEAYQKAYKPFLTELYNYPDISLILYYSGTLLEWFEAKHPEFLMLINDMVKRRQVELLGGGYHEPFFPLIPNTDRLGQIEALTTFIREKFGKRPRGVWIAESVWEPSLTSMLKNSGMDFILLGEDNFFDAGMTSADIFSPIITEDQGKILTVYPVHNHIIRKFHKSSFSEVVSGLTAQSQRKEPEKTAVIFIRGETLGYCNKSFEEYYQEKGLSRFLDLIKANKDKIETAKPGELTKNQDALTKSYLMSSSYSTLFGWMDNQGGAPAKKKSDKTAVAHKKAGNFRQLLTKYEESNLLYSKMMYTQVLVKQIRGDKARKKSAREELWKGQCNRAYWHGPNGGIYDKDLRKAAYRSLLRAEKITQEKGIFIPSIVTSES